MVSHAVHVDAVHIHAKLVSLRPSLHSSICFSRLHVCMDQIRDATPISYSRQDLIEPTANDRHNKHLRFTIPFI